VRATALDPSIWSQICVVGFVSTGFRGYCVYIAPNNLKSSFGTAAK